MAKKALITGVTGQDGAYLCRSSNQSGPRGQKIKLHFLMLINDIVVFAF